MLAFNDSTTDPRAEQLHQHYLALAERALQHYPIGLTIPTFIHHISERIEHSARQEFGFPMRY
jgi:hypothetical protein